MVFSENFKEFGPWSIHARGDPMAPLHGWLMLSNPSTDGSDSLSEVSHVSSSSAHQSDVPHHQRELWVFDSDTRQPELAATASRNPIGQEIGETAAAAHARKITVPMGIETQGERKRVAELDGKRHAVSEPAKCDKEMEVNRESDLSLREEIHQLKLDWESRFSAFQAVTTQFQKMVERFLGRSGLPYDLNLDRQAQQHKLQVPLPESQQVSQHLENIEPSRFLKEPSGNVDFRWTHPHLQLQEQTAPFRSCFNSPTEQQSKFKDSSNTENIGEKDAKTTEGLGPSIQKGNTKVKPIGEQGWHSSPKKNGVTSSQNDLNSNSAVYQESKVKPQNKLSKYRAADLQNHRARAYSDSSNGSEATQQVTAKRNKNIRADFKASRADICLERINDTDAKLDRLTDRLDHIVTLLNAQAFSNEDSSRTCHTTEPKTVASISDNTETVFEVSNCANTSFVSEIKEVIRTSITASLNMHSIWREADVRDMPPNLGDESKPTESETLQQVQQHLASHKEQIEDLRQRSEYLTSLNTAALAELQNQQAVLVETLAGLEKSFLSVGQTKPEESPFVQEKRIDTREVLASRIKETQEKIERTVNMHIDTLHSKLIGLDEKLTCNFGEATESLKSSEKRTMNKMLSFYQDIMTKQGHVLETVCCEIANQNMEQKATRNALTETKASLNIALGQIMKSVASRLERTKLELFSMVEKEGQLVKDGLKERKPTKIFTFDFYVDHLVDRMTVAMGNPQRAGETLDIFIAGIDTCVHSFPWYIPDPVDTSLQGLVKFTDEGMMEIFLIFARNPNELGLTPRMGRSLSCQVTVTDLSHRVEDIEVTHKGPAGDNRTDARVQSRVWCETNINTNDRIGLYLGWVSCQTLVDRQLNKCYSGDTVLLRYVISVND